MCSLPYPLQLHNGLDSLQALQDYPGVQVGANVHVPDVAYADDIVILSSSYSEMQDLLEAINRHATAVGMRINASKTKVMSTLIRGQQRQADLLDGEPLEDVDKIQVPRLDVRRKRPGHRGDKK